MADKVRLNQVTLNLLSNSVKYTPSGGAVSFFVDQEVRSGDTVILHVCVADNGIGIADKHLPRIFERFYRIDKGRSRSLGGTGLGLAIVKNAVTMHGGTIKAQPADGGGLCFEFTLKK